MSSLPSRLPAKKNLDEPANLAEVQAAAKPIFSEGKTVEENPIKDVKNEKAVEAGEMEKPKEPKMIEKKPGKKEELIGKNSKRKIAKKKLPFLAQGYFWQFLITGLLGLVFIGGAFFSASKLKIIVKDIREKRGQLTAFSQRKESFQKIKEDLASVNQEANIIEKALVNEEGMINFIEKIEKISQESQIEISSLNFTNDQPRLDSAGRSYVEFTIEANGPVIQLRKFLEELFNLPLLIKIKVVDLGQMSEPASRLVFRAWLYADPQYLKEVK